MKLKQWISVAVGCVFALSSAAACGPGEETQIGRGRVGKECLTWCRSRWWRVQ